MITDPVVLGDRRDGTVYIATPTILLAIDVALATGRPLLVRGPTGCGKSSLARHAARQRGWRYYEQTVTSRTQAHDLLWDTDHVRRLHDVHAQDLAPDFDAYVRPGILWWALNRASAAAQAKQCRTTTPDPNLGDEHERAVVLLDEIDKADPDVPNNLLVPLGSFRFEVTESRRTIEVDRRNPPLIIVTTNDERDLPPAFLRRCIELDIEAPQRERLLDIAQAHFTDMARAELERLLDVIVAARPDDWQGPPLPSPAELIDNIRAIQSLPARDRETIARLVVWKKSQSGRIV